MLASNGGQIFDDEEWLFDIKYDGYRCLTYKSETHIKMLTRNYKDIQHIFPEIADMLIRIPSEFILDGEIVVVDPENRKAFPTFRLAQVRGSRRLDEEIIEGVQKWPATYVLFDLLHDSERGKNLLKLGTIERKIRLWNWFFTSLKQRVPNLERFELARFEIGKGTETYNREVLARGAEGLIAKRINAPYRPGKRSKDWLKIFPTYRGKYHIVGFTKIDSILKDGIGSLHIAEFQGRDGKLIYKGKVGTGFKEQTRIEILKILNQKELILEKPYWTVHNIPKYRNAVWVFPIYQCNVSYKKTTPDGRLRHPVFEKFIWPQRRVIKPIKPDNFDMYVTEPFAEGEITAPAFQTVETNVNLTMQDIVKLKEQLDVEFAMKNLRKQ